MNNRSRHILVLAVVAAGAMPATARAQYYGAAYSRQPPPLYPYELQSNQPYAVQVAPNTYVIKRPSESRAGSYDRPVAHSRRAAKSDRPHKRNDPALIQELQRRRAGNSDVINTQKIVRDPPVVIETKRVVDDPPRIVERRHYVDDTAPAPAPVRRKQAMVTAEREAGKGALSDDNTKRVIRAEAEVTILGPDRMTIRLFRKRSRGTNTTARAE